MMKSLESVLTARNLAALVAICVGGALLSCARLANPKPQAQARNLTPGLSEELTAIARRHGRHTLLVADGSDNSEEAKNLEESIAKAFA